MGQDQLILLDNPVWNALSTSHASFAEGDELAKRYPVDVAPFAATRDQSAECYDSLAQLIRPGETVVLASVAVGDFPAGWTIVRLANSPQMVWRGVEPSPVKHSVEDLDISHIDEMLALTELTKPGPFSKRVPELGSYLGIYEGGQLVAMAGERIKLPDILRSALSARIPTIEAVAMPVHLSPRSSRESQDEMRLPSFTSAERMLKQYAYMRSSASILGET